MLKEITENSRKAVSELIEVAKLKKGDILVVGCSSSEVAGRKIGTYRSPEIAEAVFEGIHPLLEENGIFLAAQCCEHLNRAIIVEWELAERERLPEVNAVPIPTAGGSFAAVTYSRFKSPVAVEKIKADAGIDIGDTLIGMHLKEVAVPVRLSVKKIGDANLVAARTRAKFVGGGRTVYNEELL